MSRFSRPRLHAFWTTMRTRPTSSAGATTAWLIGSCRMRRAAPDCDCTHLQGRARAAHLRRHQRDHEAADCADALNAQDMLERKAEAMEAQVTEKAAGGPLDGLRIIELAGLGPGPLCAMLLGDLGAEVIRVDRLGSADAILPLPAAFDVVNRGRRPIALDLKSAAGQETLLRLVEQADALIEGFRPGVSERLGIGPDVCHARNPRLVYGRITGYGQTGLLAQSAGHDINYISLTGALHSIRRVGERPIPPLNLVGDYGGGAMFLAVGMLAALFERTRSGQGQVVDAAMVEGAAVLMGAFFALSAAGSWSKEPGTNLLDTGAPFYDVYETSDGKFVAVGALELNFLLSWRGASISMSGSFGTRWTGGRGRATRAAGGNLPDAPARCLARGIGRNGLLRDGDPEPGRGANPSSQPKAQNLPANRG